MKKLKMWFQVQWVIFTVCKFGPWWKTTRHNFHSFFKGGRQHRVFVIWRWLFYTFGKVELEVDCDGTYFYGHLGPLYMTIMPWQFSVSCTIGTWYKLLVAYR